MWRHPLLYPILKKSVFAHERLAVYFDCLITKLLRGTESALHASSALGSWAHKDWPVLKTLEGIEIFLWPILIATFLIKTTISVTNKSSRHIAMKMFWEMCEIWTQDISTKSKLCQFPNLNRETAWPKNLKVDDVNHPQKCQCNKKNMGSIPVSVFFFFFFFFFSYEK